MQITFEQKQTTGSEAYSLNAGFRVVFVTDGKLAVDNSDIHFFGGHVQSEADAGTETGSYGWTWKSIISTSIVEAQGNRGTAGNASNPGESTENYGLAILNARSHLVSENYWMFWKGELGDDIRYDASGDSGQQKVWTGSKKDEPRPDGSDSYARADASNEYKVFFGESRSKDGAYIQRAKDRGAKGNGSVDSAKRKGPDAISPILYIVETTPGNFEFSLNPSGVVPEPSSYIVMIALLGLTVGRRIVANRGKRLPSQVSSSS